ncbi:MULTISPECIES: DUF6194 family protein [Pseudonocardia]|uniref:DUF6194 domain-containing protein n=2 Tax=Pseudonocardia TaxID=1847 RepID=A0A1Y2N3W2_PSEAH|nr:MULTISPECIES: DUF6194 family protein [Pseudonocardia]OSY42155.1 hypothetical protein BG845_01653 [Pseudonocardia autotrophica]TDN75077.1 hypothetical protein C8E95_4218 [Pseudonocardia autotrophica]BBF99021.1 hypothetical protein Pdca_02310 [Pseudonocardia autotrophica]GEC23941.1 hypothetical protein PSA01_09700 [Pseudonocardia saturnea]
MDSDEIIAFLATFPDTRLIEANGDVFAVHDPDLDYERRPRQGWATVVTSDVNDACSGLDRPGVFRLNIGLPAPRFRELFGEPAEHDPAALDVLFPHPVYASYRWVSVLNPDTTWPVVRELLGAAHGFAVRKHRNASSRSSTTSGRPLPTVGTDATGTGEEDGDG